MRSIASRDVEVARPIRLILSDVDGVMTDGRLIIDNSGVESKAFHVRDGIAVKYWQKAGFQFGILTARTSQIVKLRANELGVSLLRQGFEEKLPAAIEMIQQTQLSPEEVCYIGDDLPDLPVMFHVGLSVAVADAAEEVRGQAKWTLRTPGGHGALRELIERLLKAKSRWEDFVPRPLNGNRK